MIPFDFFADAKAELDESFDWYAQRSVRAASNFTNAVNAALERISTDPEQFPKIDETQRDCPVKRFPYRIVFRVETDRILVVAVAHAKRRPAYWRDRT